jgi:hypothetical protein
MTYKHSFNFDRGHYCPFSCGNFIGLNQVFAVYSQLKNVLLVTNCKSGKNCTVQSKSTSAECEFMKITVHGQCANHKQPIPHAHA